MVVVSTVRRDPLTGDWAVVAPERIPPPPAFGRGHLPTVARCPFCPGNEELTEQELARRPYEGDWRARGFPNRRPGLHLEAGQGSLAGPLEGHRGRGAHEVIVIGRDHAAPSESDRVHALHVAADRMDDLSRDPSFASIGWYRNRGREAGSTQPHAHAQVVAMPIVPRRVAAMWSAQRDAGLVRRLVETAVRDERLVFDGDEVVAWSPWAPTHPFALRVAPARATPSLHDHRPAIDELGACLHHVIHALDGLSGFTSFNLVLTCAPPRQSGTGVRWILDIHPRVVSYGGFEAWSGGSMHPIDPVTAAAMLRDAVA